MSTTPASTYVPLTLEEIAMSIAMVIALGVFPDRQGAQATLRDLIRRTADAAAQDGRDLLEIVERILSTRGPWCERAGTIREVLRIELEAHRGRADGRGPAVITINNATSLGASSQQVGEALRSMISSA